MFRILLAKLCLIWYELTEITAIKSDLQTLLMDNHLLMQGLLQLMNQIQINM